MTIDDKGEILAAIAALGERLATETASLRRELAAGLAGQESSIFDLKAGQESLKAGHESLRAGVESSISALKKDVGALRSELLSVRVDLMARMDRLQDHMSGVRDDITVNYGAVSQTERIARSASDETRALAETVSAMQRQIRRIAAKVFGPEESPG